MIVVPPAGFEPAPPPPEGGALSPELRGLKDRREGYQSAPGPRRAGLGQAVSIAKISASSGFVVRSEINSCDEAEAGGDHGRTGGGGSVGVGEAGDGRR